MAKVKCDEIARLMTEAVQNLAAQGVAKNLDSAHQILAKDLPNLTKDGLAAHVNEYLDAERANRKERVETAWAAIKKDVREIMQLEKPKAEREGGARNPFAKPGDGKKAKRTPAEIEVDRQLARIERAMTRASDPKNPKPDADLDEAAKALLGLRKIVEKKAKAAKPAPFRRIEGGARDKALAAMERLDKLNAKVDELTKALQRNDIEKYRPTPRQIEKTKAEKRAEFLVQKRKKEIAQALSEPETRTAVNRVRAAARFFGAMNLGTDLGALGRQGGVALKTQPKLWANALKDAKFSEQGAHEMDMLLENHPNAWRWKRDGLPITSHATLSVREEFGMSQLADKIPGLAHSERLQRTFLNKLRADMYEALTMQFGPEGPSHAEGKAIATYIADATGRSNFGGQEKLVAGLSELSLSPRYYLSRLRYLAGSSYREAPKGSLARKIIRYELAKYWGVKVAGKILLGLGAAVFNAATDDEERKKKPTFTGDPRSSNFGSVRVGNMQIGSGEGMDEWVVLIAQTATGKRVDAGGNIEDMRNPKTPYDIGVAENIGRFFRRRAPFGIKTALDVASMKDAIGKPVTVQGQAEGALPIWVRETFARESREALKENGFPPWALKFVSDYTALMKVRMDDPNWAQNRDKPNLIFPDAAKALGIRRGPSKSPF